MKNFLVTLCFILPCSLAFSQPISIIEGFLIGMDRLVIGQTVADVPNPEVKLLIKDSQFPTLTVESTNNTDPKLQLTTSPAAADSDWTIRMDVSDFNSYELRYDNVEKMHLNTGGRLTVHQLKASDLAGIGDRPLVVDSDGQLKVGPVLKYHALPASSFHPTSDKNDVIWYSTAGSAHFWTAPADSRGMISAIQLPHESTITRITVYYTDNDNMNNVRFVLKKVDLVGLVVSDVVELLSTDSGYQAVTSTLNLAIDNSQSQYSLTMFPIGGGGYMDLDFVIHQVVIEYTE